MATGVGVAYFLGQPVVSPALQAGPKALPQPTLFAAPLIAKPTADVTASKVKLVPELTNGVPSAPAAPAIPEAPALLSSLAPISAAPIRSAPINDLADVPSPALTSAPSTQSLRVADDSSPAAKLRDEAPRPIGNEPRSPATIRRMPPVDTHADTMPATPISPASDDAYSLAHDASYGRAAPNPNKATSADWPAAQPLPANQQFVTTGYNADATTTPAANAAYAAPMPAADNRNVAPPPWPVAKEDQTPRTHIIEDGDSLEKLAGEYLNDPLRSKEIFELNHDVLSNPDLLPIGAELKIPERASRNAWGHQSRRLPAPAEATIRQAANGNLVPIRHSLSYEPENEPAPRAQLAAPMPIE